MSTNIELNLIGGSLLARDAEQRSNNRTAQLQNEKESKAANDPAALAAQARKAMRGERGKDKKKRPEPAATPSSTKQENIAMFMLYAEEDRFGISSVNSFPATSWYSLEPPPQPVSEIPPHTAGNNETIENVISIAPNKVRNETYVLPAGKTAAVIIHVRNFISCAQRISARIGYRVTTPLFLPSRTIPSQAYSESVTEAPLEDVVGTGSRTGTYTIMGFGVSGYPTYDEDGSVRSYVVSTEYLSTVPAKNNEYVAGVGGGGQYVTLPAYGIYRITWRTKNYFDTTPWAEVVDYKGSTYIYHDTNDSDNYGVHTWHYGDHYSQDVTLENTVNQTPLFYTVNCYYVDENGSKEISCPSSVSTRVRLLNPELQVKTYEPYSPHRPHPQTFPRTLHYRDHYEEDWVMNLAPSIGGLSYIYTASKDPPDIAENIEPGNDLTYRAVNIYPDLSYDELWDHDSKVLIKCFGLIGLQNDLYDNFRTPAYFKFFEGTADLQTIDLHQSYSYVRSQHLADFNPPYKLLQPNQYNSPEGYLYFYSTNKLPESVSDPLVPLQGAPAAKIKDPNNMKYYLPIICWDWGRPDFCINQLKALGFTNEDLAPTTTP
jgi:hypothetical protein